MRNLKKFLALVLAMMMVFSLMVTVNAATVSAADYQDAYDQLARYKVFQGGTGADKADIGGKYTRAQMSTVVYRLMTGDETGDGAIPYADYAAERFDDVKATDWFAPYVGWAANADVVIGYPNGNFGPNDNVTGFQTALMLLRTLGRDYYKEYTDAKDWQLEVGSSARQLGILQNADVGQLTGDATRGLAAYLVNNAVKYPYIVEHAGNGTYTSTNKHLISVIGTEDSTDDWGIKGTTTNYSFNWPAQPVLGSYFTETTPLATFYGPVTECDVAEAAGVDGKTLRTYTNGYGNKGWQYIDELDTTNYIGANGRETLVYSDRIVYRDRVLVEVTSVNGAIYDTANHEYLPASTTVTVYGNVKMEGIPGNTPDGYGTPGNAQPVSGTTYTIAGSSYTKGQLLTANILTTPTGNTLAGGALPYDPSDDASYSAAKCPARLQNVEIISPTSVTVNAISYDGNNTNRIVGFVGTDGQEYRYDVSYGYYDGGSAGSPATVLNNTAIGKTYDVFVFRAQGKNYVLGIDPAATVQGVGVVTGFKVTSLGNIDNSNNVNYVIEYQIFTEDYNTVTVTASKSDTAISNGVAGGAYTGEADAIQAAAANLNKLVKYEPNTNNKYNTVTLAYTSTNVSEVQIGDADAFGGNVLVDDDTVFFVANYNMNNSLNNGVGAYVLNNYSVYNGFQKLPYDLKDGGVAIYEGENQIPTDTTIRWYAFNGSSLGTTFASKSYASYVLILDGTEQITNVAENVADYAYVNYSGEMYDAYQDYYLFRVLKNGVADTLRMANTSAAFGNVRTNGSGLYTYADATNGTYGTVTGPVNKIPAGTNWNYNGAGVLEVPNGVLTQLNGLNQTSFKSGTNLEYLTVTQDTKIYIVNNTTGKAYQTNASLDTIDAAYINPELYFQLNQYGWIDFIYVVDNMTGGSGGGAPTSGSIKYTVNIVNPSTGAVIQSVSKTDSNQTGTVSYTVGSVLTKVGLANNSSVVIWGDMPSGTVTVVNGATVEVVINIYYKA